MSTSALHWRRASPVILKYGIAILSVAAGVVINLAFDNLLGVNPSVSLLLCTVMLAAWLGGTGPALLAIALTVLAFDYFFLQPTYSFVFAPKEIPRLVIFTVAALFVVWLSAAQRRAAASLQVAHDEQQETVRELQELNEKLRVENTERKRAENAQRQSEADLAKARHELQLIIDTVPVLVLRHRADGVIDFVNQVGRSYSGLVTTNWTKRVSVITHPDDVAQIEEKWDVALATGEPFETETRLRRADGEYRWFATRRVPLRNDDGQVIAWYAATYDIEDRKRAEDALRRSEAQLAEARRELELTIDSIPVMVSTFEPDGTRIFVNQTWQDYTGHTQREATGAGLDTSAYYHPDDIKRFDEAWRAARAKGEMLSVDVRTRRADGTYRWYTMRRAPRRDDKGNIVKWYSVGVDVEEQKIAEDAARKSQETLHAAQTALAHASRVATLGEISATIAHEVNQPLAAIVANGQACLRFLRRDTPDLDNARNTVEWIVKDGNRAGEVVRRVRGLLKNTDTEKTRLDVNDLIREVAALLQGELTAQRVALQLELAPRVPPVVADRIQLQQVIINLVMNGAEAMRPITDRPHGLVIRSYQDEPRGVVVAVKDNGVGIPGESADRLFDAFFTTKPGGLGVGLSICRTIVEAHGGRLWSSANIGPGATFHFALPSQQAGAA